MTHKELIKEICSREGKKSEVSRGNVKEVFKCIKILFKKNPIAIILLLCQK